MSRSDLSLMNCSVAQTVALVGDAWTQMLLREMFLGSTRFDTLQKQTGASPHLISNRLKKLESEQIVKRVRYLDHPPRDEYKLTERGRDLWPIIIAFKNWGDRWLDIDKANAIKLTHSQCGHTTRPYLACSACGDPIHALTSVPTVSADMQIERHARSTKTERKPT